MLVVQVKPGSISILFQNIVTFASTENMALAEVDIHSIKRPPQHADSYSCHQGKYRVAPLVVIKTMPIHLKSLETHDPLVNARQRPQVIQTGNTHSNCHAQSKQHLMSRIRIAQSHPRPE